MGDHQRGSERAAAENLQGVSGETGRTKDRDGKSALAPLGEGHHVAVPTERFKSAAKAHGGELGAAPVGRGDDVEKASVGTAAIQDRSILRRIAQRGKPEVILKWT